MDVHWYLRRLSLMSPQEIVFRAFSTIRTAAGRIAYESGLAHPHQRPATAKPHRWLTALENREQAVATLKREYGWTPGRADALLAHRFTFFAFSEKDFGPKIRWDVDQKNNVASPLTYGPALDYRDESLCGDIKYVWEPNRFLHLPELAKAYYLTGTEEYGEEVFRQLDSWMETCPYPKGVNWASSLEIAIRLINWCITHEFIALAPGDISRRHGEVYQRWMRSIGDHLRFLRRHRSRYSSANNHLIGELAGLYIGSICFSLPGSERWIEETHDLLEREAQRQHWPDGVNKEQAVRYQAFVFDFLLLSGVLGTVNGYSFSGEYWTTLERSAEYVRSLLLCGEMPVLGDDDDGRVVALDGLQDSYRTMLGEAARLFGRDDFALAAGHLSEQAYLLLGPGPSMVPREAVDGEPRLGFPNGGIYLLTGEEAILLFDCGPLGYLSLAAHGHADALSIVLSYRGKPIFVDPGTYAYHTQRVWRDHFRGTFAHNTVRVDGQDQSEIGGNFMWLHKANASILKNEENGLAGWHDGYLRLSDPVRHEREIRFERATKTFVIMDRLSGTGHHTFDLTFTLSPECQIRGEESRLSVLNGDAGVTIQGDPVLGTPRLLMGSENPIGGWYSPGLDRKEPTTTIWWKGTMDGDTRIVTRLQLEPTRP